MKALICVDCQNYHMTGGSMVISDGDKIIPVINELLPKFDLVIFTKKQLNENIIDFETDLHKDIDFSKCKKDFYIFKRKSSNVSDSDINKFLEKRNVTDVYIVGLALDQAVADTAIDAVMNGFKTVVIEDATRPINEDINKTLKIFKETGIFLIESWELDMFNLIK